MPFSPRLAPLRRSIPALLLLSTAACAPLTPMPQILAALQCGPLIPASLRRPIPATPLPLDPITVGGLGVTLSNQTGQLDLANRNTATAIEITEACDRRSAEVFAALQPKRPWWRIF